MASESYRDTNTAAKVKKPALEKSLFTQIGLVSTVIFLIGYFDQAVAAAVFYGSFIFIIPNIYFAWQSFRYVGSAHTKKIVYAMRYGQLVKFFLTVFMFVALFRAIKPEYAVLVFVSYLINVLIHFIATANVLNKSVKTK